MSFAVSARRRSIARGLRASRSVEYFFAGVERADDCLERGSGCAKARYFYNSDDDQGLVTTLYAHEIGVLRTQTTTMSKQSHGFHRVAVSLGAHGVSM